MAKFDTLADKERLLCYAAALLSSKLSNPSISSSYTAEGLTSSCIKDAAHLIDSIFDDAKLQEILK